MIFEKLLIKKYKINDIVLFYILSKNFGFCWVNINYFLILVYDFFDSNMWNLWIYVIDFSN